jgi:glycosyltransferase involved in cell wall biosynthesis
VKNVAFSKQQPVLPHPVRITEQTWPDGTVPVVSVFSWAYNHVEFIRESIDSILMQETTFPVEIIIHDDASTDGTANIIREYEGKYPQLFRNILHLDNQHSCGRSVMEALFAIPKGNFIALTHGDDYWTNPHKLQTQADYLSKWPSCAGCFHRARVVDDKGSVIQEEFFVADQEHYDFKSCLTVLSKQYATCSMMVRTETVRNPSAWLRRKPVDMFLELQVARYGTIAFIDKNMADYRRHGGGVWSCIDTRSQALEIIHRYRLLLEDLEMSANYGGLIKQRMSQFEEMLVVRSEYDAVVKEINALRSNRWLSRCRRLLKSYLALRGF